MAKQTPVELLNRTNQLVNKSVLTANQFAQMSRALNAVVNNDPSRENLTLLAQIYRNVKIKPDSTLASIHTKTDYSAEADALEQRAQQFAEPAKASV